MVNTDLQGKSGSFWEEMCPSTNFPALEEGLKVDVAIIGGGIAGITSATLLKEKGQTVAVLEANKIVKDVTLATTAKISVAPNMIYSNLISTLGKAKSQKFAIANMNSLKKIADIVSKRNINCDFKFVPFYIYTELTDKAETIKSEVNAAKELGLTVSYTENVPLPFETGPAALYENQAQFHPRKYLLALSEDIPGEGSYVFENTRAIDVKEGKIKEVVTNKGSIMADNVIMATNTPIYDPDMLYNHLHPGRSYVMGVYAKGEFPEGMFVDFDPVHTYRRAPTQKGQLIIVAGEHHDAGKVTNTKEYYNRLENYARQHLDIESIEYHWSSQDNVTDDGLPLIGMTSKEGVYVATGFGFWGMTTGTTAAMVLTDLITGKENQFTDLFYPTRFKPVETTEDILKQESTVKGVTGKEISRSKILDIVDISPDEAKTFGEDGEMFAAYMDTEGNIHALQAVCTHRGCLLNWNNAEKSWDCPCHGSRFSFNGEIIHGPAVKELRRYI
jgi:glycine/D-amino acid oxidase-like deaminating enzyme/nitrite reductase/ring-hydroxylating ferredoxin subunit